MRAKSQVLGLKNWLLFILRGANAAAVHYMHTGQHRSSFVETMLVLLYGVYFVRCTLYSTLLGLCWYCSSW